MNEFNPEKLFNKYYLFSKRDPKAKYSLDAKTSYNMQWERGVDLIFYDLDEELSQLQKLETLTLLAKKLDQAIEEQNLKDKSMSYKERCKRLIKKLKGEVGQTKKEKQFTMIQKYDGIPIERRLSKILYLQALEQDNHEIVMLSGEFNNRNLMLLECFAKKYLLNRYGDNPEFKKYVLEKGYEDIKTMKQLVDISLTLLDEDEEIINSIISPIILTDYEIRQMMGKNLTSNQIYNYMKSLEKILYKDKYILINYKTGDKLEAETPARTFVKISSIRVKRKDRRGRGAPKTESSYSARFVSPEGMNYLRNVGLFKIHIAPIRLNTKSQNAQTIFRSMMYKGKETTYSVFDFAQLLKWKHIETNVVNYIAVIKSVLTELKEGGLIEKFKISGKGKNIKFTIIKKHRYVFLEE